MTAVAEIAVKGCSRVLGLLTTGKPDSYVAMVLSVKILTIPARLHGPDRNAPWARFWPVKSAET